MTNPIQSLSHAQGASTPPLREHTIGQQLAYTVV